ncbi:hypothetical protein tb265_24050 [Gemmatimonadetes bacterium T265]|nr:hypothetical protein tb265_24050 [Gemmatimonadetes bacterium T265]
MTHDLAPRLFTHYDAAPALEHVPKRTENARGVKGDPVNVALVGSEAELREAMRRAGWRAADPITRASSIAIARSVLLRRADSTAPVSPLYLFGRPQDVAFEREVGRSASRRHHVRLWQAPGIQIAGRAVWVGDAAYDLRAGISRRGFHPTHHIAPDVDAERDTLVADLARAGQVAARAHVTGVGPRVDAHNAEGDRYDTDGELTVVTLSPNNAPVAAPPLAPDPPLVALKEAWWAWFHPTPRPPPEPAP